MFSSNNAGLIQIYRVLERHLVDSFKNAKNRSRGKMIVQSPGVVRRAH